MASKQPNKDDPTQALQSVDIQPLGSFDRKKLESMRPDTIGVKAVGGKIIKPPKTTSKAPDPPVTRPNPFVQRLTAHTPRQLRALLLRCATQCQASSAHIQSRTAKSFTFFWLYSTGLIILGMVLALILF